MNNLYMRERVLKAIDKRSSEVRTPFAFLGVWLEKEINPNFDYRWVG